MSNLPDIEMFTALADKYGDSINTLQKAEEFFDDFFKQTNGVVIVDYLDSDNDDRIEKVAFDHNNGLMTIYTRLPEKDPVLRKMRRMALPFDSYSILVRCKNVRFVRVKDNKCMAIIVNGYTMHRNMVKAYANSIGSKIVRMDEKGSFFTTNVIMNNNADNEYLRAMTTPITSFWIIPKGLMIHPQDSDKYLYLYNTEMLYKRIMRIWRRLDESMKSTDDIDEQEDFIKMYGNQLRCVAEGLFKLVTCFYFEKYECRERDREYNNRFLGDVVAPLKKHVYKSQMEMDYLAKIARTANELSHETGLPIKYSDLEEMYNNIMFFILDFKEKVDNQDNIPKLEISAKPSPNDYIKENLKTWNFSSHIKSITDDKESNCSFRLKINPPFHTFKFTAKEDNYLCKDGMIRTLKYEDLSDALVINSRENFVSLGDSIYSEIKNRCDANGFDSDCYLADISSDYEKRGLPQHLFTLDEIRTLMRNADDSQNNKLVIDENGYAHVIQDRRYWNLYPVSIETWGADNGYVGANSSLEDAEPSYHLCLTLWLVYLQTGKRQYDDLYVSIDEKQTISKILTYYKGEKRI